VPNEAATANEGETVREEFERDGYLVFDPGISDEAIDAAIARIEPEFRLEGRAERFARRARRALLGRDKALSARHEIRIQDAWAVCDEVREIATAPRVMATLRELYGREPRPFQTINFRYGSEQHPHSDAWHFNSEPAGLMCGVWVALEDVDMERGPLVYYPGSQRLSELTSGEVAELTGESDDRAYERVVRERLEREGFEPRYGMLRKGQALVWSSNLVHGGAPQTDRSLTRWSQVTHYFLEGCRFWKPNETSGETVYFSPTFIS
jgi:ectoine hydroxylase-related dioxygenase (phytanoyl-CoA dioxygenase family)